MKVKLKIIAMVTGLMIAFGIAGGMDKADARLIHSYKLELTNEVQSLTVIPKAPVVYSSLWNEGHEIPMVFINRCYGEFNEQRLGIHVTVVLTECETPGVKDSPFKYTYVTTKKDNDLMLKLTTTPVHSVPTPVRG